MVVNVKSRAIEGPIDPATIPSRPDVSRLEVIAADAAWKSLK
jgi:hypothetical protein